jgi:hypothetical protein
MASEKQIAANLQNSKLSSGPKSTHGKMRSASNSTKHGLASQSPDIEAEFSPEFLDRRARWGAEQNPEGEAAEFALDRAVAATFRIERCEHALNEHIATVQQRAKLTWVEDQAVEAAAIFARLGKDPILASRQLQTTLAGVVLLMETWLLLAGLLEPGKDWSESERSRALDLLGIDPDLRNGRTPIDAPEGTDPVVLHEALALDELDRLESLRDQSLIPLDEMDQRQAMKGDIAMLSKPAKLLLRYEREAWNHFNKSMKEVKNPTPPVEVAPPPIVVQTPKPPKPPVTPTSPTFEEQRRALLAEAAPYRKETTDRLNAMGITDEDAMLDEFERRLGILDAEGPFAPERSQFVDFAVGRGS